MQVVNFNLLGIYRFNIPLIILNIIFFSLGLIIALALTLTKIINLKSKLNKAQKIIKNTTIPKEKDTL